jgi:hypothetical protein
VLWLKCGWCLVSALSMAKEITSQTIFEFKHLALMKKISQNHFELDITVQ